MARLVRTPPTPPNLAVSRADAYRVVRLASGRCGFAVAAVAVAGHTSRVAIMTPGWVPLPRPFARRRARGALPSEPSRCRDRCDGGGRAFRPTRAALRAVYRPGGGVWSSANSGWRWRRRVARVSAVRGRRAVARIWGPRATLHVPLGVGGGCSVAPRVRNVRARSPSVKGGGRYVERRAVSRARTASHPTRRAPSAYPRCRRRAMGAM